LGGTGDQVRQMDTRGEREAVARRLFEEIRGIYGGDWDNSDPKKYPTEADKDRWRRHAEAAIEALETFRDEHADIRIVGQ
jgi:hypothetical protein